MLTDTVLEIRDLSFAYNQEKSIYQNFSLTLKRGELKSIVGASGSGKSTLFELILKNLQPQNGTITLQRLSEVFQDPYSSFHPSYTIRSQIADVADITVRDSYLARLDLEELLLDKLPHELSGGQLQRCSILRALLMKPDLLLLDEPTSALDNVVQLEIMKMLVDKLDDMGILLITHDAALAKWCSDDVIRIDAVS